LFFFCKDLKSKKKKKKKKKKKGTATGNEDSSNVFFFAHTHGVNEICLLYFDVDDESAAMNPGLIDGSATSALEDGISTSDFGDFLLEF
jgi:hypothetical protein